MKVRLGNAEEEMEFGLGGGNFDAVVVNDTVEKGTEELVRAIEAMYPGVQRRRKKE